VVARPHVSSAPLREEDLTSRRDRAIILPLSRALRRLLCAAGHSQSFLDHRVGSETNDGDGEL